MQIIGIVGRKRHGKDTVGQILREEFGYTPIAIADPIKRICMDLYGFSYDQVYGDTKEVPDERWDGLTPRHAMQQLGTEVGRTIFLETWVRYAFATMQEAATYASSPPEVRPPLKLVHLPEAKGFVPFDDPRINPDKWVIVDIRYPNEARRVWDAGGTVIRVIRPSLEGTQGDTHASEVEQDSIVTDLTIYNDGTLEDLRERVRMAFGLKGLYD